jgi:hypothetical protein
VTSQVMRARACIQHASTYPSRVPRLRFVPVRPLARLKCKCLVPVLCRPAKNVSCPELT